MSKKDQFLGILSRVGKGLVNVGEKVADEARVVADLSKLRVKLKDLTYEYKKTLQQMGQIYYDTDGQADHSEYVELIGKADTLIVQIADLQEEIDRIMAERKGDFGSRRTERRGEEEDIFAEEGELSAAEDEIFALNTSPDEEATKESVEGPTVEFSNEAKAHPCPSCGRLMSDSLAYCTHCGERLE